jgi:hypothetical protein
MINLLPEEMKNFDLAELTNDKDKNMLEIYFGVEIDKKVIELWMDLKSF